MSTSILRCRKDGCAPNLKRRAGADHSGDEMFVCCAACARKGPYIECERPTEELGEIAIRAWNDDIRKGQQ